MSISVLLLFGFYSCSDTSFETKDSFKYIDYSYSDGWDFSFSMFIDSLGCVYVKKNKNIDSMCQLKLSEEELSTINALLFRVDDNIIDSIFKEDFIMDLPTKILHYHTSKKENIIYVYSQKMPSELDELLSVLYGFIQKNCTQHIDTAIHFKSENGLYPPPPPEKFYDSEL